MLTTAIGVGFVYCKHQKELQEVELQKKMESEKEKTYLYHAAIHFRTKLLKIQI